jgi:DNA-binding MarR family transcriptional regulator
VRVGRRHCVTGFEYYLTVRQSNSRTVRSSNNNPAGKAAVDGTADNGQAPRKSTLIDVVATEIALGQAATADVDAAAADVLGLNSTDLRCLGRLHAGGALTAGELASAVGLSKGAMTAALDRLERAGYVRRVRRDEDRRSVRVEVSPRAERLLEQIWGPLGTAGKAQLAEFTIEQLEFLVDFLRRGRDLQEREAARIRAMPRRDASGGG